MSIKIVYRDKTQLVVRSIYSGRSYTRRNGNWYRTRGGNLAGPRMNMILNVAVPLSVELP